MTVTQPKLVSSAWCRTAYIAVGCLAFTVFWGIWDGHQHSERQHRIEKVFATDCVNRHGQLAAGSTSICITPSGFLLSYTVSAP